MQSGIAAFHAAIPGTTQADQRQLASQSYTAFNVPLCGTEECNEIISGGEGGEDVKEEEAKHRIFELEKTRIEVNSPHGLRRGGAKEDTVQNQMVMSLKLIPEFDEKVTEWFRRFEKKAAEFDWPQERWVGLVANMLKGEGKCMIGIEGLPGVQG